MKLSNWGNFPVIETKLKTPRTEHDLEDICNAPSLIGRGLGRCYGDSALNQNMIISSQYLNKMLEFQPDRGILVAEAGVSLAEIVDTFAPRGWFVPVTPGTKFVSLGGAIASDVHGKNHHIAGTFGQHVLYIDLMTAENGILRCSPTEHADLFYATCGGHGLTGFILRVAVQLIRIPSIWIRQCAIKTKNLMEIMEAFEQYAHYSFSVAWIDCLKSGKDMGRAFLMCGEFAQPDELIGAPHKTPFNVPRVRPLSVPFNFPSFALNSLSVKMFNALYYAKAPKGVSDSIVSYNTFFYPLDAIHHWNRIYGRPGFTQYQFVIPKAAAFEGLPKILQRIAHSGLGSFLAVLKLFGKQPTYLGNISFPTEGYTLALDFPITSKLFPLLNELDCMILDYGGRHYMTKDCRLSAITFQKGYGSTLKEFLNIRDTYDPYHKFQSMQSKRLGFDM